MSELRPFSRTESAAAHLQAWQPQSQQAAFRQLLDAFSYPGRVVELESPGTDALALVLATLIDGSTTLADPHGLVSADDCRRLGAMPAAPERAQFVVLPADCSPAFRPALGTLESPEGGATLILRVDAFGTQDDLRLSGPGIEGETHLSIRGIDPAWWALRSSWNAAFPLGVDLILVAARQVVALPRTTRVHVQGAH